MNVYTFRGDLDNTLNACAFVVAESEEDAMRVFLVRVAHKDPRIIAFYRERLQVEQLDLATEQFVHFDDGDR
jgi:hypothetical protein